MERLFNHKHVYIYMYWGAREHFLRFEDDHSKITFGNRIEGEKNRLFSPEKE